MCETLALNGLTGGQRVRLREAVDCARVVTGDVAPCLAYAGNRGLVGSGLVNRWWVHRVSG